ncbi:TlpA family protein disulfide reductase [Moheibacter stercoris]|uniref:Thiol-disulfide isomerase/thioredoxin n=1 Tax=Moheibacter stercoris TaxID=1628251 RepID=A0ABV2LUD9_9FLAO
MSKKIMSIFAFLLLFSTSFAQESAFPDLTLPDLKGNKVNIKSLSTEGKPVVLAFWATWCGPCMQELNAINDLIEDWRGETEFAFYAVSIDDSKSVGRVQPLVNGKGWDFEILLDTNNELKRQLNFSTPPFTVIIKDGNIMYRHLGYQPGAELNLYEKIKEFSN